MFLEILRGSWSNEWLERSHLHSKNIFSLGMLNVDAFEGGNGDHWPNHSKSIIGLFFMLFYWSLLENTTTKNHLRNTVILNYFLSLCSLIKYKNLGSIVLKLLHLIAWPNSAYFPFLGRLPTSSSYPSFSEFTHEAFMDPSQKR